MAYIYIHTIPACTRCHAINSSSYLGKKEGPVRNHVLVQFQIFHRFGGIENEQRGDYGL